MENEVEVLRERIAQVARAEDGRRIFTAAIRKDAVGLAKKWKANGREMAKLAAGIGVHKTTLAAWVGGPQSRKKARIVRPVKVAVENVNGSRRCRPLCWLSNPNA